MPGLRPTPGFSCLRQVGQSPLWLTCSGFPVGPRLTEPQVAASSRSALVPPAARKAHSWAVFLLPLCTLLILLLDSSTPVYNLGVREIAQWLKHLHGKHKVLSSTPGSTERIYSLTSRLRLWVLVKGTVSQLCEEILFSETEPGVVAHVYHPKRSEKLRRMTN